MVLETGPATIREISEFQFCFAPPQLRKMNQRQMICHNTPIITPLAWVQLVPHPTDLYITSKRLPVLAVPLEPMVSSLQGRRVQRSRPNNLDFQSKYGKNFDDCRDGSSNTIAVFESSRTSKDGQWNPLRKGWAHGYRMQSGGVREIYSGNSIVYDFPGFENNLINANLVAPVWNQVPASSNHSGGCWLR